MFTGNCKEIYFKRSRILNRIHPVIWICTWKCICYVKRFLLCMPDFFGCSQIHTIIWSKLTAYIITSDCSPSDTTRSITTSHWQQCWIKQWHNTLGEWLSHSCSNLILSKSFFRWPLVIAWWNKKQTSNLLLRIEEKKISRV